MVDIEEIRRRKLLELYQKLKEKQEEEKAKEEQIKAQIEQMEEIVKSYLTKEARERLNNLRIAHPEKYLQALQILYYNIVTGRLNRKLTDEDLKKILRAMFSREKKETKIRIIHEY